MDDLLDATSAAEQAHFWYHGFRRFVRPLLEQAIAGLPRPRLLDCGCGTGTNLRMLGEYGEAFGFDLTWRGLKLAQQQGIRRIAQASVTHAPYASDHFDLVTSFDILYCLTEPDEEAAIAEMNRLLRHGGALIVNVAALDMLRGNHSVLGGEVRRYTAPRLRTALERGGFEIVRLTYTNATTFPLVAGIRFWQRVRGVDETTKTGDFFLPPAPLNTALKAILAVEAAALRWTNMPIGSSLLCLARKRAPAAAATSESFIKVRGAPPPRTAFRALALDAAQGCRRGAAASESLQPGRDAPSGAPRARGWGPRTP